MNECNFKVIVRIDLYNAARRNKGSIWSKAKLRIRMSCRILLIYTLMICARWASTRSMSSHKTCSLFFVLFSLFNESFLKSGGKANNWRWSITLHWLGVYVARQIAQGNWMKKTENKKYEALLLVSRSHGMLFISDSNDSNNINLDASELLCRYAKGWVQWIW